MKPNDFGHWTRGAIAEVTADGVANHFAELFYGFALSADGVTQCNRNVTAFGFVFSDFEDDLAHTVNVARGLAGWQGTD